MRELIKIVKKSPKLMKIFATIINNIPFNNVCRIQRENAYYNSGLMMNSYVSIKGKHNTIRVVANCSLKNTRLVITGNQNIIVIDENCHINGGRILIDGDHGSIYIGKDTILSGNSHLAAIEGKSIVIGEGCLFSSDVIIRTGDSHSIVEQGTRHRINEAKDVTIGKHVWIGFGATVLKGVDILDNSIIGTEAVVTKSPRESNCIVAGNPAKVIKRNIDWLAERI